MGILPAFGSRMETAFAVLLTVCLSWLLSTPGLILAPTNMQCPTSAVQQITIPVRSCCGDIIRFETRAPRPGDKQFMQCHCAEKSAGQQQISHERVAFSFTMLGATPVEIVVPPRPASEAILPRPSSAFEDACREPLIPPPSLV
ncbi:hypothetical protein BH11ARM1_BH11ARM1_03180 [soil metagenome]